jgi:uncharacterized repeat protein (TIGR01451 family)
MAPGQYGTGATQEIPNARPNSVAGWGRVDLGFMDAPSPDALWVDDHTTGIATGQQVSYADTPARPLEVQDSSQPLRVMLAWTDPPASLSAAQQLVNDLDLRVIGPGGAVYYGNNVATGDRINNVEGIVIDNPPVGQYSVEVRGFNVPIASQPYALAVARQFAAAGRMNLIKTANPATYVQPGGLITYTLQARAQGGPLSGVVLSDTLPANTTFVSASGAYTRSGPNNSVIAWSVGSLADGQTAVRTLTVRVSPTASGGDTISNMGYSVSAAGVAPLNHPPVNVTLQEPPPPKSIWLPLITR